MNPATPRRSNHLSIAIDCKSCPWCSLARWPQLSPAAHPAKGCCETVHACMRNDLVSDGSFHSSKRGCCGIFVLFLGLRSIPPQRCPLLVYLDWVGLPKGQETHLPALCLLWILDIFPFDLQGIHHLGGEAVLSPSASVPSIFQVSLRIPFGEIRSRFTEELAFISLSAPTGICNCIMAFIIFYLCCGCKPSVSFHTQ